MYCNQVELDWLGWEKVLEYKVQGRKCSENVLKYYYYFLVCTLLTKQFIYSDLWLILEKVDTCGLCSLQKSTKSCKFFKKYVNTTSRM